MEEPNSSLGKVFTCWELLRSPIWFRFEKVSNSTLFSKHFVDQYHSYKVVVGPSKTSSSSHFKSRCLPRSTSRSKKDSSSWLTPYRPTGKRPSLKPRYPPHYHRSRPQISQIKSRLCGSKVRVKRALRMGGGWRLCGVCWICWGGTWL